MGGTHFRKTLDNALALYSVHLMSTAFVFYYRVTSILLKHISKTSTCTRENFEIFLSVSRRLPMIIKSRIH